MNQPCELKRRSFLHLSFALLIMPAAACSTQPTKQPIVVDVSGVDDVPKLIQAIKKSSQGLLPEKMPDSMFFLEFARTFVKNAWAAAENGFKIPTWVLDRLPARKVMVPVLGVMIFNAYGAAFAIPVSTVIIAVLGSIALMASSIYVAIRELTQNGTRV